jgi:hypothetical protein
MDNTIFKTGRENRVILAMNIVGFKLKKNSHM